jgi:DNA topoisomerase-1
MFAQSGFEGYPGWCFCLLGSSNSVMAHIAYREVNPGMGTPLVIVESPAKARTISRFLGDDYKVEASVGHIRDLAKTAKDLIPSLQKAPGAKLGVDTDNGFVPYYVVPKDKKAQVKHLRECLDGASALYLATDEDREGESISWHLLQVLKPEVPVHRLVFHEITVSAIQKALASPRKLDESLVRAQEARRIVDRLFGYPVSALLWKKVGPNLSAGRVQSVAVRLIVNRERARMAHISAAWWDIRGPFSNDLGTIDTHLTYWKGEQIVTGRDFNAKGELKGKKKLTILSEAEAKEATAAISNGPATVLNVEERPYIDRPAPPFTTSTLQQEANRRFKWTARKTMNAAQRLYENGWITYMRTDSTVLSAQAISAARSLISIEYGDSYVPDEPRVYKSKAKNAQEAHEAIRPAGEAFRSLDEAKRTLGPDERRVYELIWKRTVGSQMRDARGHTITVTIEAGDGRFEAKGKTVEFAGYRLAYIAGSDDAEAAAADLEKILPPVKAGDSLTAGELEAKPHATKPPPRLTEAALVKELEERGIGRPSTYASIIDTIIRREYVFKKGSALVPTWTAFAVTGLLESEQFSWLVDYDFTAQMENQLDDIAMGEGDRNAYLEQFWSTLKNSVEQAGELIDPRQVCTIEIGRMTGAICKKLNSEEDTPVVVRVGKYGPFLQAGDNTANLPDELPPDELTLDKALELLQGPKALGEDPETGFSVFLANGRFGWYVQLGENEQSEKPRRKSVPRGMKPDQLTFETAHALLLLPRNVGAHPESGTAIMADYGRYGAFVKCGEETRSIRDKDPTKVLTIDVAESVELLNRPKGRKTAEVLKELGEDPSTKKAIRMMDGRYGPYVTDGDTNASLGKTAEPESLTLVQAIELIRVREKAPKRKRRFKKKK